MSSVSQPGVTDPMQYEELPAGSAASGWIFVLMHLAVGGVSLGAAVSEDFAAGRVLFANTAWRVLLGLVGALLVVLAVRGITRTGSNDRARLTPELRQRVRLRGWMLVLVGGFLALCALAPPLGDRTIAFDSWTRPFYVVGGAYLALLGLLFQWNPTRTIRQARVARGEGRPGTARILRADDTGLTVNDDPQVKIDFEITLDGYAHQASDKIVMDRAKLALLIPGSTVNVLVDRVDVNVFHVDWDSWQPPQAMQGGPAPVERRFQAPQD